MEIMTRLNQETGVTFVFATHDPRVIHYARRQGYFARWPRA